MYRDNTLIPSEAVRLLALGVLASGEQRYSALAAEVRHFTGHMVGPSLDLVAPPLELLKIEGLVETTVEADDPDEEALRITEAGRAEFVKLLTANLRAPVNDINKLILALKMRFLHLLEPAQQLLQVELLAEMSERELTRLSELRSHRAGEPGQLVDWLDQEIAAVGGRLEWFRDLEQRLAPT
jgi:DNA-binding PadR family transcriptional regulator